MPQQIKPEKLVFGDLKLLYKRQVKGTLEEIGEQNRHLQELEDQLFVGFTSYILSNAGYNDTTLYNTPIGDDQVFEEETTKTRLVDWVNNVRFFMGVKEEENILEQLGGPGEIFVDYPRYLTWSHFYEHTETKEKLQVLFTQDVDITSLFKINHPNWKIIRGIDQTRKNYILVNPNVNLNRASRELRDKLFVESIFLITVQDLTNQFITRNEKLKVLNDWVKVRDEVLDMIATHEPIVADAIDPRHLTLEELMKRPESNRLEFKSSITYDLKLKNRYKKRIDDVVKALSALMNTDGGVLVLGIADNPREVLGLEKDIEKIGNESDEDAILRTLTQITIERIGLKYQKYIHPYFEKLDGKLIGRVDVDPAQSEVYCKCDGREIFYVRTQNITKPYEGKEALEYIKDHWKYKKV